MQNPCFATATGHTYNQNHSIHVPRFQLTSVIGDKSVLITFLGQAYFNITLNEALYYSGFLKSTDIHCFVLKSNTNVIY